MHMEENEEEPTRSGGAQNGDLDHGSLDHLLMKTHLSGKQRSYQKLKLNTVHSFLKSVQQCNSCFLTPCIYVASSHQHLSFKKNTMNQKSNGAGLSDPSNTGN